MGLFHLATTICAASWEKREGGKGRGGGGGVRFFFFFVLKGREEEGEGGVNGKLFMLFINSHWERKVGFFFFFSFFSSPSPFVRSRDGFLDRPDEAIRFLYSSFPRMEDLQ